MNNSKIQNEKKERKQAASSHKLLASHGSRSPDHQPAAPFLAASPPKNQQQQCAAGQAAPPLREAFLAAVSWPGLPEAAERAGGERVRRPGVVGGGEGGEGEKKQQQEGNEEQPYEEYEVVIDKPYGFKFAKGRDGGTYIDAIFPGAFADKTGKFTVGDKVLATRLIAVPSLGRKSGRLQPAGYGQTMYCIRQRVGPLYMKMEKRFGKWDGAAELTEKEVIRAERNSGMVSNRVREIQLQNYQRKMEQKMQREEDLRLGLRLYKDGKYEEALEKFESVLGSKPESNEASIASYNVACCYSKLDRIQAGLSALEDALKAGYEDFKKFAPTRI